MFKAALGKEIIIDTIDEVGVLAEIVKTVAEKGVGILAINASTRGGLATLHLVTDDNLRAMDALKKKDFFPHESKVVLAELPHKPGLLNRVTEDWRLAHIEIEHFYASALSDQKACLVVLSTSDNDRAVVELNKWNTREPARQRVKEAV